MLQKKPLYKIGRISKKKLILRLKHFNRSCAMADGLAQTGTRCFCVFIAYACRNAVFVLVPCGYDVKSSANLGVLSCSLILSANL